MYCTNCGKEIKEAASFCKYCGYNTHTYVPSKISDRSENSDSGHNSEAKEHKMNKTVKPVWFLALMVVVVIGGYWIYLQKDKGLGGSESSSTAEEEGITTDSMIERVGAPPCWQGDYVVFGAYEQDGDLENGKEPIEWVVIGEDENGYLLASRYVLDSKPYADEDIAETHTYKDYSFKDRIYACSSWKESTLRKWLNDDFYSMAFTYKEQHYICEVNLKTESRETSQEDNSPLYSWADDIISEEAMDSVFVLGREELLKFDVFDRREEINEYGNAESMITQPTRYALNNGVNYSEAWESSWWWLRNTHYGFTDALIINEVGSTSWDISYENRVGLSEGGVRPALYVREIL